METDKSQRIARHRKVKALFEQALELPEDARWNWIRANSGDPEVEREVEQLLKASAKQGAFLAKPAWNRAPDQPGVNTGMQFGPYKVIRQLQGGGMGSVYLTVRSDEVFRRMAALKVIRPDCMTPDLLRRFHQERQILAEVDHPNVARIIDGGTTPDGMPYFVMEYVDGDHIDSYCAKQNLGLEQRLELFEQVCRAVAYLHQRRIVHRDLKPSNILIAAGGVVKLVDFGIAKALDQAVDHTRTAPLMTPGYASPEQMLGELVEAPSDVYSLGVILYELLTGRRPFETQNVQQMISAVTTTEPAKPSRIASTSQLKRRLTGDLDTILLMALRREPERRYRGAAEFAADIHRYLHKLPVMARKDTIAYRANKFLRRNRLMAAAAALIVALSGWGLEETIARQRLEERIRQLQQTTRTELNVAEEQQADLARRPDAEKQLEELRRLADVYKDSFALAVRLRPGMTPERHELILRAENYFSQAKALIGNDPGRQAELAGAYLWLGDIRGYPGQANLNDSDGALQMYAEAESLAKSAGAPEIAAAAGSHAAAVRQRP